MLQNCASRPLDHARLEQCERNDVSAEKNENITFCENAYNRVNDNI